MRESSYCLFDTPVGACGIAWIEAQSNSGYAITLFQLPEATPEATERRIALNSQALHASAPTLQIAAIIKRVCQYLGGEPQDFGEVPVNLDRETPFVRKVCEAARAVPAGQTWTYGDLARAIGQPHAVRAVGHALGRNPIPLIIPCHRVLAAHGRPGGFSAYGGLVTKAKLLALEGVAVNLCLEFGSGA